MLPNLDFIQRLREISREIGEGYYSLGKVILNIKNDQISSVGLISTEGVRTSAYKWSIEIGENETKEIVRILESESETDFSNIITHVKQYGIEKKAAVNVILSALIDKRSEDLHIASINNHVVSSFLSIFPTISLSEITMAAKEENKEIEEYLKKLGIEEYSDFEKGKFSLSTEGEMSIRDNDFEITSDEDMAIISSVYEGYSNDDSIVYMKKLLEDFPWMRRSLLMQSICTRVNDGFLEFFPHTGKTINRISMIKEATESRKFDPDVMSDPDVIEATEKEFTEEVIEEEPTNNNPVPTKQVEDEEEIVFDDEWDQILQRTEIIRKKVAFLKKEERDIKINKDETEKLITQTEEAIEKHKKQLSEAQDLLAELNQRSEQILEEKNDLIRKMHQV